MNKCKPKAEYVPFNELSHHMSMGSKMKKFTAII